MLPHESRILWEKMSNFSSAGQIEKAVFLFQLTFYVTDFSIQTPWLLREFQKLGAY